ncbi:MAG: sensor histidine kinase [Acidobacteria bacterium]|nr:sensor histidine kinase [Acidobacteriota bacterium]
MSVPILLAWFGILAALAVLGMLLAYLAGRRNAATRAEQLENAFERLIAGETAAPPGPPDELSRLFRRAAQELARQRQDEQLLADERRARVHDDALRSLAARAAGRLGEGLAGIATALANTERLAGASGPGGDLAHALAELRRALARSERTVRALRALSPAGCGSRSETALGQLVELAVRGVRGAAEAAGVAIGTAHGDRELRVVADTGDMVVALEALLENAVQAAARGGRHVTVRLASDEEHARAVVLIEDDGPGIPPQAAEAVFDPLFTTRQDGGGIGLGLPLARSVAQRHGGSLRLRAREGGGTVAELQLPSASEPSPARAAEPCA